MSSLLTALCLSIAALAQQEPGRDVRDLILGADREAAVRATLAEPDPARQARLQAAALPGRDRATAMVAVAQCFPNSPESDHALLAASAALVQQLRRTDALRVDGGFDLLGDEVANDEDARGRAEFAQTIEATWRALRARQLAGGDPAELQECERLLQIASVTRFGFDSARIAPDADRDLAGLAKEQILLRASRIAPAPLSWDMLRLDAEPEVTAVLQPGDAHAVFPALAPGNWMLQLSSMVTPWRALRRIEVSDIDVVALAEEKQLAVLALRHGEPFDGRIRLIADGKTSFQSDIVRRELFDLGAASGTAGQLLVDDGTPNSATLDLPEREVRRTGLPRFVSHLMVDRPLHRPGETVVGRWILRRCITDGDGLDLHVRTEPARHEHVIFTAFAGSDHEVARELQTDEQGVLSFEVPVSEDEPPGWLKLSFVAGTKAEPWKETAWPTTIASFRRPVLTLRMELPDQITLGSASEVDAVGILSWAAGGPASGLTVTAEASAWSRYRSKRLTEHRSLISDAAGRVVLPIDLTTLWHGDLECSFSTQSPDGRTESAWKSVRLLDPPEPAPEVKVDAEPDVSLRLALDSDVVAGQNCKLHLHGKPDDVVLLVVGRGRDARVSTVELDHAGDGATVVYVRHESWPQLDLEAATRDDRTSLHPQVALRAASRPVIEVPAQCAPGASIDCVARGLQAGAVVTFAVVDERIFRLQPDQTSDPDASLRPTVSVPKWTVLRSNRAWDPRSWIAPLLHDGVLPPPDHDDEVGRRGSGGAGAASPGPGGPATDLRMDFRATAAFATAIADSHGVATTPVRMPDDLTTWRVTVIAVDPDGTALREQRAIETTKALSAEPILPRVARAGDRFEVGVVLDHRTGPDRVDFAASVAGDGLEVATDTTTLDVPKGTTVSATLRFTARSEGAPLLDLQASDGAHSDHSQRALPVLPDAIERRRVISAEGRGEGVLHMPADLPAGAMMDLTLFGSDSAVWATFEHALSVYPHGCVEQTLSRLLPYFARARAARSQGLPAPTQDHEFTERLAAGLKRLRRLFVGKSEGFAWWPGESADDGMTALVLHGLCVMREGGLDPRSVGLDFDLDAGRFLTATDSLLGKEPPDLMSIEMVAAALRWSPGHARALEALRKGLDGDRILPPGLLARCGLALLATGDRERARSCLDRARSSASQVARTGSDFPGEAEVASQALCNELALGLGDDATAELAQLTIQMLASSPSTYATSCALTVLAGTLDGEPARDTVVLVVTASGSKQVTLDERHGYRATLRGMRATDCTIRGDAHQMLIARAQVVATRERASDHAAWAAPLEVTRELGTYVHRDGGSDWKPLTGSPHVGETCFMKVNVRTPTSLSYLVVECPLPTGFELMDESWQVDRFDDRLAVAIRRLSADAPFVQVFRVIPTVPGHVMWPPITANSMYDPAIEGGSAGGWLDVEKPGEQAIVDVTPCFAGIEPEPAHLQPPPTRAEELAELVRDARDVDEKEFGRASEEKVSAAVRELVELAAERPGEARDPLAGLLWHTRVDQDDRGPYADWWREIARQLRLGVDRCVIDALGQLERDGAVDTDDELLDYVTSWICDGALDPPHEALVLRMLHVAARRGAHELSATVDAFEGPVHHKGLRTYLLQLFVGHDDELGRYALARVQDEDFDRLPPSMLLRRLAPLDNATELCARVWRRFWSNDTSRIVLLDAMRNADFVRRHAEALVEALPVRAFARVPLADSAIVIDEGAVDDPLAFLAAQGHDVTELQQALAISHDSTWSGLLAQLLVRAGVPGLGDFADPNDRVCEHWNEVLRIAVALDVEAAARKLADDLGEDAALDTLIDTDSVVELLWPLLVRRPQAMKPDSCRRLLDVLPDSRLDLLLEQVAAPLPFLPDGFEEDELQAWWDYGARTGDTARVRARILASPEGAGFLAEAEAAERMPRPPFVRAAEAVLRDGAIKALAGPTATEAAHLLRLRGL